MDSGLISLHVKGELPGGRVVHCFWELADFPGPTVSKPQTYRKIERKKA